ncbi:MAG: tetratricopeptide repeat protein, partial [Sphingobacterium siyangense]
DQAITIGEDLEDDQQLAQSYSNIANSYISLGRHTEALTYLNKAIAIAQKHKLPLIEALAIHNIGMVYHYQNQDDKAIHYYSKSLELYESNGDSSKSTFILGNIGHLYLHKGDYKKADELYSRSLTLAEQHNNKKAIGNALQSLGALNMEKKQWQHALTYYFKAKKILESTGEQTEYLRLLDNLTTCYLGLNDQTNAYKYADQCYKIATKQGQLYYIKAAANNLSTLLQQQRDFAKSLEYFKAYKLASDSLYSVNNKEQLVRQEEQYKHKQQQQQEEIVFKNKVSKRNYLLFGAAIIIIVLFFSTILLVKNIKHKRGVNLRLKNKAAIIEDQNLELEASDKFKESLISVIAHDIRQPINSLRNVLLIYQDGLLSPSETQELLTNCNEEIEELTQLIDTLLIWVTKHMQSATLEPENFRVIDVFRWINRLYAKRLEEKEISLTITCKETLAAHADQGAITIVVRNLIDNAIKFCETGGRVSMSAFVSEENNNIVIQIADDGIGLDPLSANHLNKLPNEKGYGIGLKLCKHYLVLSASKLTVTAQNERGTCFEFTLDVAI